MPEAVVEVLTILDLLEVQEDPVVVETELKMVPKLLNKVLMASEEAVVAEHPIRVITLQKMEETV